MNYSFWSILYLAYRVAPLMIVMYFIFASVINQDFKGLIYLIGLIFTCAMVHFLGSIVPADFILRDIDVNSPVCNSFSIGQDGYYSNKFPFSIVVFSFTFFYIFYVILQYGLLMSNIPFICIFPALIVFDIFWNKIYRCANFIGMAISLILAGGLGLVYSMLIEMSGLTNLMYMTGGVNNETCQMAAQTQFKCTLRKLA